MKSQRHGLFALNKHGNPPLPNDYDWTFATPDDVKLPKNDDWIVNRCNAILHQAFPLQPGEHEGDQYEFLTQWQMYKAGENTIRFLLRADSIKGFIVVGTLPITGTALTIPHIWVYALDNDTRGRGAGAYLLHRAFRLPAVEGADFVSAHVYQDNSQSLALLVEAAKRAGRGSICIGTVSPEEGSQEVFWDEGGPGAGAVEREREGNPLLQLVLEKKSSDIWEHWHNKPPAVQKTPAKPKPKKKSGRKGRQAPRGFELQRLLKKGLPTEGSKRKPKKKENLF